MAFCAMLLPVGSWSLTLLMATNHWSVSMGSITWPVRVQIGTDELVLLHLDQRADGFEVGHHGLAGHEAVHAPVLLRARSR